LSADLGAALQRAQKTLPQARREELA